MAIAQDIFVSQGRRQHADPGIGAAVYEVPSPQRFALFALGSIAVAVVLNIAAIPVYFRAENVALQWLARMFMLDAEASIPTLLNFLLFITAGLVALLAALSVWRRPGARRWHWVGLAAVMTLLAYDEAASIHEEMAFIGQMLVANEGVFFYTWIVPGGAAVLAFALTYARFLLALPRTIALLLTASGALFVSGAIGMEMVGGVIRDVTGERNTIFYLATTVEEACEMAGLTLFTYSILLFLTSSSAVIDLRLRGPRHT